MKQPSAALPRVIVTRPEQDAQRWVRDLQTHGLQADALPLIEIAAATQLQPVHRAWKELASYQAAMCVSANAVRHF